MGRKAEKPSLTENEIRSMMELYDLSEADESGFREWLSYRDVKITKETAAQFLEIKKQFDNGLLDRKSFEERKKVVSNDYDEKLDKKLRAFVIRWFPRIFLASVIICFALWSLGLFSFKDERPTIFIIYQEAQLVNSVLEDVNLRLPLLKLTIKIQNDPVFREVAKEINVSCIIVDYNISVKEPKVDILVNGERSRGLIEIEGKKLPLRPNSIEWIAVITFHDKKQEEEWLMNINRERFILKQ